MAAFSCSFRGCGQTVVGFSEGLWLSCWLRVFGSWFCLRFYQDGQVDGVLVEDGSHMVAV